MKYAADHPVIKDIIAYIENYCNDNDELFNDYGSQVGAMLSIVEHLIGKDCYIKWDIINEVWHLGIEEVNSHE